MSPAQILEIVGLASLALIATKISWRTPLGPVGAALVFCAGFTDLVVLNTKEFGWMVMAEVIQAVLICHEARLAFMVDRQRPAMMVVALIVADLAWCAVQPLMPMHNRGFWFGTGTNLIFAIICLCVAYPGVRDARLVRRDSRRRGRVVGVEHANPHAQSAHARSGPGRTLRRNPARPAGVREHMRAWLILKFTHLCRGCGLAGAYRRWEAAVIARRAGPALVVDDVHAQGPTPADMNWALREIGR